MIIWINGAFGSGKTQTAHELHRRLPGSHVYDPENIGFFIRRSIPPEIRAGDFQDNPLWREFNYSLLRYMATSFAGVIIVPMTVVNPLYFGEIVGRLRSDGVSVEHFALCASREVLRQRLKSRGEKPNSWPEQQIDRCVDGLADPVFAHHLDTDRMSIDEVVEHIAAVAKVQLQADNRGPLRKRFDRVMTQVRSIRFFS